jgi:hypothetical protein
MLLRMGTAIDAGLIQLRCQRSDHRTPDARTSPVFFHHGHWAYCEAGKFPDDHQFVPTGGVRRPQIEAKRTEVHP